VAATWLENPVRGMSTSGASRVFRAKTGSLTATLLCAAITLPADHDVRTTAVART
jgi:hypothetical protein